MGVRQLLHQLEPRPKLVAQLGRTVPADFQAAALIRTVNREGADNQVASDGNRAGHQLDVLPTIPGRSKEVEYSPIVPNVELAEIMRLGNIGDEPLDLTGLRS